MRKCTKEVKYMAKETIINKQELSDNFYLNIKKNIKYLLNLN